MGSQTRTTWASKVSAGDPITITEHDINDNELLAKINAVEDAAVLQANVDDSTLEYDSDLHIKADGVNGSHIADDSIDSEHYVDGSIDTDHLSADCVTGDKIADDAIGAEHIEQLDADIVFSGIYGERRVIQQISSGSSTTVTSSIVYTDGATTGITLPAHANGRRIYVNNILVTDLNVYAGSGQFIPVYQTTYIMSTVESAMFVSDGTNWFVFNFGRYT